MKVEVAVLGSPFPNSPHGLCGRRATLNSNPRGGTPIFGISQAVVRQRLLVDDDVELNVLGCRADILVTILASSKVFLFYLLPTVGNWKSV